MSSSYPKARLCKLAYETFASTTTIGSANNANKSIFYLHGMLGSKKNWRTPAKEFSKLRPDYTGYAFDHRGHGESALPPATIPTTPATAAKGSSNSNSNSSGGSREHRVVDCAYDLMYTLHMEKITTPNILIAHSFGGKVAIEYLRQLQTIQQKQNNNQNHVNNQVNLPQHVWVLDSLPGIYHRDDDVKRNQQSVFKVIETLQQAPKVYFTRKEAIEHLTKQGIATSIAQWLATSLVTDISNSNQVRYCFDIEIITSLFEDFCDADYWQYLEQYQGDCNIHYLRAGKNAGWTSEVLQRFDGIVKKNDKIHLWTMPHVGHWLHAEDPSGVMKIIDQHST